MKERIKKRKKEGRQARRKKKKKKGGQVSESLNGYSKVVHVTLELEDPSLMLKCCMVHWFC